MDSDSPTPAPKPRQRKPAIRVTDLHEVFRIYAEAPPGLKDRLFNFQRAKYTEFHALNGVSIDIMPGERVGLVGHNGSGKSTLLKCMARILPADKGTVELNGRVATLLELGAGFSPELTGRENMYLNGSILGLSRAEVDESFDRIVDFAGVRDFIDTPVKNYSSGMYVRLGFAIAVNVDPDILLVDEVLAVGDQTFQERSMARMRAFAEAGKTVVLVSHDLNSIEALCDRVVVLEGGHIVADGPAAQALAEYRRRLAAGHGTDLHVPDLPEPSAHETDDDEEDADPLTHAVRIDDVTLTVKADAGLDQGEQAPIAHPGSPATLEITATPTEPIVGDGGLYVRVVVRRPDLNTSLYESRTSYQVLYLAAPPEGASFTITADLTLNVLSGTYLVDVEIGNAETEAVHAVADGAARVVVHGDPWDVGIAPLDMTFQIANPDGVWPPESHPPPVEEGGPRQHPDPRWPLGGEPLGAEPGADA